eukprot:806951-Pelagomonas_calceolata.AAC.1
MLANRITQGPPPPADPGVAEALFPAAAGDSGCCSCRGGCWGMPAAVQIAACALWTMACWACKCMHGACSH